MTDARALFDTFAAHLPEAAHSAVGAEEALANYMQSARNAWPGLAVEPHEFVRHMAARAVTGEPPPLTHAGDLYLAFACARGVAGAADAFHRTYGGVITRVLSRRRAATDVAEDAAQAVHERLLVGPPPKIADYTGAGPLRSWVSTTAATTLAMMRRSSARRREEPEPDDDANDALAVATSPELRYVKEKYKSELVDAIKHALTRLSDRDRTLLRLHLGERTSIDRLAAMYKVDRSTAARWLSAARESLVLAAREEMRTRLRLNESECESIAELVKSELHVSFVRLLE